jgi:hypothetical protein
MSTDTHFLSRKLHFTVSLAALALGLLVAGCGKQTRPQTVSEEEAKELYNRANLFVSKIGEGQYSYEYLNFHYQQSIKNIDRILTAYPDTEYARKLRSGDLKLGAYSLDQFRNNILVQLGDMKEATESVVNCAIYLYNLPEANRAESRQALALILETLCRLVRTDEALIFPTLPDDSLLARETIVRVVSRYQQQDAAMSLVESAEPGDVQALAAAYGEGMAVGGLQREDLDGIMEQFGSPELQVELGILRGMIERESGIYRDLFDKVKKKREEDARRAALEKGITNPEPTEPPVRYDVEAFYREKFSSANSAPAALALATFRALQGQLDEARALVANLDGAALATVMGSYYEHLALTNRLTKDEALHRRVGLSARDQATVTFKLVELLAQNAKYVEADAVKDAGIAAHPELRDHFVLARFRGQIYSREELFYLNASTIPELGIQDPAICARALLDWFLSPNRLLKGSSWGADQILFKYFSIDREGRPASRNLKAKTSGE